MTHRPVEDAAPHAVRRPRAAAMAHLVVAVVAFVVMAGALRHPPVWDDIGIVRHIENLYRDGGLTGVALAEWRIDAAAPETGGFYRPLAFLSLWADNRLALSSLPWNHLATNVALHVACSLALLALLFRMFPLAPALLAALLFAAHPVHVESVALAANRTDLLACLFALASTLAWRRATAAAGANPAWPWFGASLAAFLLGGLSKEVALALPAALLAWTFLAPRHGSPAAGRLRACVPWLLGWTAVLLALFALRHVLGIGYGPGAPAANRSTAAAGLPGFLGLWGTYARLLVFPWPLKAWYGMKALHAGWAGFAGLSAIVAMTVAPLVMRRRDTRGVAGLAWTAAFLLPVSGVVPLLTATAAERFLYLPSAGYAIVAAALLHALADRFPRARAAGLAGLGLVIVVMGAVSFRRMAVWGSEQTLAGEMIKVAPDDPIGYGKLGLFELERGNYGRAIELTREAVRRAPDNAGLYVNLGIAFEGLGSADEAISAYGRAIGLAPGTAAAVRRLPPLLAETGRHEEALAAYERAVQFDPTDATTLNTFGTLLSRLGRFDDAMEILGAAVDLAPDYAEAHYNLGATALNAGAFDRAVAHLGEALRLRADYPDALNNLGIAYAELGRFEDARRSFARILEIDPGNAQARGNLERLRAIAPRPAAP